jgi:peptidoglycan/xylan/chitin deacetylase (PgdA/CDA1 family)
MNKYYSFLGGLYLRLFLIVVNIVYKFYPSAKILLYHGIGKPQRPLTLSNVEKSNFFQQMAYLKKQYNVISVNDLYRDMETKSVKKKTVVITFDDGYLDNYIYAFPILKKYNIPATIFCSTFLESSNKNLANDKKKIKELIESGLIIIGAHTKTHMRLAKLKKKNQQVEIKENKIFLQRVTGKKVDFFAYPYGQRTDYTKETMAVVKGAGFKLAFSAFPGIVTNYSDKYRLPRFPVKNWNLQAFKQKTGL